MNALMNALINTPTEPKIMELATQTHLTQLRDLLTGRLRELRAEVQAAVRLNAN